MKKIPVVPALSNTFVRPLVRRLHAYVPGEQPKVPGLIKLNTNESPFPPAPAVLRAVKDAVDERLRLYPQPAADTLRAKLAAYHGCSPEHIIVTNGSDELLALATRAFVDPFRGNEAAAVHLRKRGAFRSTVQYFTPSYSLYPVLADGHGSVRNAVPLNPDFTMPPQLELKRGCVWDFEAALTFITTPNAPAGRGYATTELEQLCRQQGGLVVLDEAYADFAGENALSLALKLNNVLVARTFSKAFSLCFQRVGYGIGHPELIAALHCIRDSYNVNGLGQIAAAATLDELPYYRECWQRIRAAREQLTAELTALRFEVLPSQANFVLVRPPQGAAAEWLAHLRARKILVRWFDQNGVRDYLRITIGSERDMNALVKAAKAILRG